MDSFKDDYKTTLSVEKLGGKVWLKCTGEHQIILRRFTPATARQIAAALIEAANKAESENV